MVLHRRLSIRQTVSYSFNHQHLSPLPGRYYRRSEHSGHYRSLFREIMLIYNQEPLEMIMSGEIHYFLKHFAMNFCRGDLSAILREFQFSCFADWCHGSCFPYLLNFLRRVLFLEQFSKSRSFSSVNCWHSFGWQIFCLSPCSRYIKLQHDCRR